VQFISTDTVTCPECKSTDIINLFRMGDIDGSFANYPIVSCNACNYKSYSGNDLLQFHRFSTNLTREKERNMDNPNWALNQYLESIIHGDPKGRRANLAVLHLSDLKKLMMLRLTTESSLQPAIKQRIAELHETNPVLDEISTLINGDIPLLKSIDENTFGYLASERAILGLNLNNTKLKVFPERLTMFYRLKSLYLSLNSLHHIPESIENLQKLEILHLNLNELKLLPDTIGKLSSLRELRLDFNHFENLPDTIGALKNLETLILHGNKFREYPTSITNLVDLKSLSLEKSELLLKDNIKTWLNNLISGGCDVEIVDSSTINHDISKPDQSTNYINL